MARPTVRTRSPRAATDPFAATLARFDQARLTALLARRSDLVDPPPRDLDDVLRRAAASLSVSRAVDHVDSFTSVVLQAAMALGGRVRPERIAEVLGPEVTSEAVARAVEAAEGLLVAAVDADGFVHPHPVLADVMAVPSVGPPARSLLEALTADELKWVARQMNTSRHGSRRDEVLDAIVACLADGRRVRRLVDDAPPAASSLARRLARHGGQVRHNAGYSLYPRHGARRPPTDDPVQWLCWHGLVVRSSWDICTMPMEVTLALREGILFDGVVADRPVLAPAEAGDRSTTVASDDAALSAAARVVADVENLLETLSRAPVQLLKSGDLGARQLRKIAKEVELPEDRSTLLVELAAAAGLLGDSWSDSTNLGEALPTPAFDDWCALDVADRWLRLATAWMAAETFLGWAGSKDDDGKRVPALRRPVLQSEPVRQRQVTLARLAEMPPGRAPDPEPLVAAVQWDAPLALEVGPLDAEGHVAWVLAEAAVLGLVHGGALSCLGRHLVAGAPDQAAEALRRHAGRASTDFVLQADLTALSDPAAPRTFRERLAQMADVESKGAAVMHRFSAASLRRALDGGLSAAEILGFLEEHATKGVPQPLRYLVEDTARRHGTIRVGAVRSYARFADQASATEALRSRPAAKLGLRQIAPTVLVSAEKPEALLLALRDAGFFPAQEDAAGNVLVSRLRPRRAPRPLWRPPAPGAADPAGRSRIASEVERLLAGAEPGGKAAADGRSVAGTTTTMFPGLDATDGVLDDLEALLRLLDGERPDRPPRLPCSCQRPTDIGRDPDAITSLLHSAWGHDWTVRVAVRGCEQDAFYAEVEGADEHGDIALWAHHEDRRVDVALDDLEWARVLTFEEERALFCDPGEGR